MLLKVGGEHSYGETGFRYIEYNRSSKNRSKKQQSAKIHRKFAAISEPYKRTAAQIVVQIVTGKYQMPCWEVLSSYRGTGGQSRARHISMYLMHILFSFSYTEIGRLFGKDRTTISYACRTIEDLRDHSEFDEEVSSLENLILSVVPDKPDENEAAEECNEH